MKNFLLSLAILLGAVSGFGAPATTVTARATGYGILYTGGKFMTSSVFKFIITADGTHGLLNTEVISGGENEITPDKNIPLIAKLGPNPGEIVLENSAKKIFISIRKTEEGRIKTSIENYFGLQDHGVSVFVADTYITRSIGKQVLELGLVTDKNGIPNGGIIKMQALNQDGQLAIWGDLLKVSSDRSRCGCFDLQGITPSASLHVSVYPDTSVSVYTPYAMVNFPSK